MQLAAERERQRAYERDYPYEAQSMKRTALRPYVFAAHKYSVYFAPWMATQVPLRRGVVVGSPMSGAAPEEGDERSDIDDGRDVWDADAVGIGIRDRARAENHAGFKALDRGVDIEWYGRTVRLSPPILAHAALLRFFDARRGRYYDGSSDSEDEDDDEDEEDDEEEEDEDGGDTEQDDASQSGSASPITSSTKPRQPKAHRTTLSASHDRDFQRLIRCADPCVSPGMSRGSWRGVFAGAWEGTFSFFEFDAYGEMLAGHTGAIYAGPFGVQRQVWKLRETFVRRKLPPREGSPTPEPAPELEPEPELKAGEGSDVDLDAAGNGQTAAGDQAESQENTAEEFPLHGPATNANFPLGPSTLRGGLASARAEETALQETIQQQVEAMGEEYEDLPDDELAEMEERAEEVGLEMLLTGTGHSAWGRFLLKGRVRYWDGLATCVKEYAVSESCPGGYRLRDD